MDRRLTLINDMVKPCGTAADIGADHGFLICALVACGRAKQGIAADINPMPLEKAKHEITVNGLDGRVCTMLADGLEGITLGAGDGVVIAGMGGELIARILGDWRHHTHGGIDYYLQPMTKPERLREYLYKTGFEILEERCCVAGGRPYSVLHAQYMAVPQSPAPIQLYLGKIDPQGGEAERRYCRKLCDRLHKRLRGIEDDDRHSVEAEQLRGLIVEIDRRLTNEGKADF